MAFLKQPQISKISAAHNVFVNGVRPNLTHAKLAFEITQGGLIKANFTIPIFNATKISPHFSAVKKRAGKVKFKRL